MRRGGRRGSASGRYASSNFEHECDRCGRDIDNYADSTKTSKGKWIHKKCAGGGRDDE